MVLNVDFLVNAIVAAALIAADAADPGDYIIVGN